MYDIYVLKDGDTIDSISDKYGTDKDFIYKLNEFSKINFEPTVTEKARLPRLFYSNMYLDTWDWPINPGKDEQLVIEILIALYLRRDGIPLLEMAGGREGWGGERQGRK